MPTFALANESTLSSADLLGFAAEQSANEASRCTHAAEAARARGMHELADLFEVLAKHEPAARELGGEAEKVRRLLPPALGNADPAIEEARRA